MLRKASLRDYYVRRRREVIVDIKEHRNISIRDLYIFGIGSHKDLGDFRHGKKLISKIFRRYKTCCLYPDIRQLMAADVIKKIILVAQSVRHHEAYYNRQGNSRDTYTKTDILLSILEESLKGQAYVDIRSALLQRKDSLLEVMRLDTLAKCLNRRIFTYSSCPRMRYKKDKEKYTGNRKESRQYRSLYIAAVMRRSCRIGHKKRREHNSRYDTKNSTDSRYDKVLYNVGQRDLGRLISQCLQDTYGYDLLPDIANDPVSYHHQDSKDGNPRHAGYDTA